MRKMLFVCLFVLVAGGGVAFSRMDSTAETEPAPVADLAGVGALGRIEPCSEVIQVNAPSVMEPPVVEQLLVDVGDDVQFGQILAVLDSHRRQLADVEQARAAVLVAEKSLAQVQAGARSGDIEAQEALVEKTQARLDLAEKQLERVQKLVKSKAASQDDVDIRESEVIVLRRELRQHSAALAAIREIRVVDIERAEAEIIRAKAELQRADADLEVSNIRSPITGQVLRVNTRAGERIDSDGLLDLGDTRQMDVVAEVHESDILKIRKQQSAKIFIRNLSETLSGEVIEVGRLIGRRDVLSNDPVDDTDARVVEVRIRLRDDDGRLVAGMSFARVEVTIETEGASARPAVESDTESGIHRHDASEKVVSEVR